jgi:hypothetical protein
MASSKKPDFFIVGAAKSGTTALYHYLRQHPDIYMSPIKEPNFFSTDIILENLRQSVKNRIKAENIDQFFKDGMKRVIHRAYIRNKEQYLQLFSQAASGQVTGEASPSYLYSETAAQEIFKFNENSKIIIILREPSGRAYSHYLMDLKLGFTQDSFKVALEKDRTTTPKGWGASSLYLELGQYYNQVKRYFDTFPSNHILVLLQKDLYQDKSATLKKLFDFLGVSNDFVPHESDFKNESTVPKNKMISYLLKSDFIRVKARNFLEHSPLKKLILHLLYKKPESKNSDEETKKEIKILLKDDVIRLSKLINRNLDEWLK